MCLSKTKYLVCPSKKRVEFSVYEVVFPGGGRVVVRAYVCFFKKIAEIFKMKFCSYSPGFPIDYNDSMKY